MGHVLCWEKVLMRSHLTYNALDAVLGAGGGASWQRKIQVHLWRRILCMVPLDLIISAFTSEHLWVLGRNRIAWLLPLICGGRDGPYRIKPSKQ